MKRSVAIFGPTPQFVRWAISQPCPLRELDVDSLPDGTFRQLRGLREFSAGKIENRVFENVCVHPASSSNDIANARGFHSSEVLDAHGGAAFVDDCCRSCPANSVNQSRPETWAGCYGWLPATSGFRFETSLRESADLKNLGEHKSHGPGRFDFVKLVHEVIEQSATLRAEELFVTTTPRWYGIWMNPTFSHQQVEFLLDIFESAIARCVDAGTVPDEVDDLIQFRDALNRCVEHRLTLHVDLVPPGDSDGQTWTLAPYCPDCRMEMSDLGRQNCSACGRIGNPHGQRKSKVLGLRPYVNLVGMMGEQTTAEFMKRFESRSLQSKDLPEAGNHLAKGG